VEYLHDKYRQSDLYGQDHRGEEGG
jgi:hypothetical protein